MVEQSHQDGQYVVFRLAVEDYGIAIGSVREIILRQELTRMPQMPDFVEGVINLRGRIVPIINLRKRFGLPAAEAGHAERTIVAEIGGGEAGLLVDTVVGVRRLPGGSIQAPPEMLAAGGAAVIGVAYVEDQSVILLDPNRILMEHDRVMRHDQVQ